MAFAVAQAVDIAVFSRLRRRVWWLPPVASSVPASVLDTGLFFGLAFFATEVPWVRLAAGDLLVKGAMVFILLLRIVGSFIGGGVRPEVLRRLRAVVRGFSGRGGRA